MAVGVYMLLGCPPTRHHRRHLNQLRVLPQRGGQHRSERGDKLVGGGGHLRGESQPHIEALVALVQISHAPAL